MTDPRLYEEVGGGIRVPKIIHFIWAGGDKAMRKENIKTILDWKQKNPDFRILLWVDRTSCSSEWNKLLDEYKALQEAGVVLKDIEDQPRMANQYVRYEIDRLRPNYGASSDLLRYRILYEYGGVYLDSDVKIGDKRLNESAIFNKEISTHCLYVNNNSQGQKSIGNDFVICTRENPVISKIAQRAEENYKINNDEGQMIPVITHYYDDNSDDGYIETSTIRKTGPKCVRDVVLNADESLIDGVQLMDIVVGSGKNQRSWINTPVANKSLKDAEVAIRMTIKFEIEQMRILRLDDHVDNLIDIKCVDERQAAQLILQIVIGENIQYMDLLAIKVTFAHQDTIDFCREHNLLLKTYLYPLSKQCIDAAGKLYYESPMLQVVGLYKLDKISNNLMDAKGGRRNTLLIQAQQVITSGVGFVRDVLEYIKEMMLNRSYDYLNLSPYLKELQENIKMTLEKLNEINTQLDAGLNGLAQFEELVEPIDSLIKRGESSNKHRAFQEKHSPHSDALNKESLSSKDEILPLMQSRPENGSNNDQETDEHVIPSRRCGGNCAIM